MFLLGSKEALYITFFAISTKIPCFSPSCVDAISVSLEGDLLQIREWCRSETLPIFPEIHRHAGCYCNVSKWHKTNARHAGCYCDVSRWRRFGTDRRPLFSISRAWNMHRSTTNPQNTQPLNLEASPLSTQLKQNIE